MVIKLLYIQYSNIIIIYANKIKYAKQLLCVDSLHFIHQV